VFLLPGTFAQGNTTLHPKTGVGLTGSGIGASTITGRANLSLGGVFAPHDLATWSLGSCTVQNTLATDFAACIGFVADGGNLTLNNVLLLCGTDGIYVESSGTNNVTITGSGVQAIGTWDWLHADDNGGGGGANITLSNVTAAMDGSTGYQQPAQSTGIGITGACTLTITNAKLSAANGPSNTITLAAYSGATVTLNNATLTANGSVGSILVADAHDAGTVINLHSCTFDPAKTAASGGAVINVT